MEVGQKNGENFTLRFQGILQKILSRPKFVDNEAETWICVLVDIQYYCVKISVRLNVFKMGKSFLKESRLERDQQRKVGCARKVPMATFLTLESSVLDILCRILV